jgi:hypothetical protein
VESGERELVVPKFIPSFSFFPLSSSLKYWPSPVEPKLNQKYSGLGKYSLLKYWPPQVEPKI